MLLGIFFAAIFGSIISDPSWLETREALTGRGTKVTTWIGFIIAITAVIVGLAYFIRSFKKKPSDH